MACSSGAPAALHATPVLQRIEEGYPFGSRRAPATLEEERREVLESVRETIGTKEPDADCLAACSYLLRHLAGSARSSLNAPGAPAGRGGAKGAALLPCGRRNAKRCTRQ